MSESSRRITRSQKTALEVAETEERQQVPVYNNIDECHNVKVDTILCHDTPAGSYKSPLKSADKRSIKALSNTMKNIDLNEQLKFDDHNIDAFHNVNIDTISCRYPIAGNYKSSLHLADNRSVKSLSNNLKEFEMNDDLEFDEERERLNFEARLMRKKAEALEKHIRLLGERKKHRVAHKSSIHSEVGSNFKDNSSVSSKEWAHEEIDCNEPGSNDRILNYLKDCKENKAHGEFIRKEKTSRKMITTRDDNFQDKNYDRIDLPKVELPKYDGKTVRYWSFIRQFETQVESRTRDPGHRLLHLMNCCVGEAKEAIESCAILPPAEGYAQAKALLKRLFGRCHVVSREIIDEVTRFPRINKHDTKSLTKLYVKMMNCWTALKQMNYMADINSINTLQQIADKFYDELNDRWVRKTCKIYESGREPEFTDLMEFVDNEATISQSRFAERRKVAEKDDGPRTESRVTDRWRGGPSRSVNYVRQETRDEAINIRCVQCGEDHKLSQCPGYNKLPVNQRWDMIKQKGCCFSCLLKGHTVKECRSRIPCGMNGCVKRHHPSLHVDDKTSSTQCKLVCNSLREADVTISLGVIPVKIIGPKGTEVIHALLDTGANITLIQRDVVNRLGITGVPTRIEINTVLAESSITARKCSFTIESTDATDQVRVKDAFAVESLPIKLKAKSMGNLTKRWAHLDGVQTGGFSDEQIVMIIGCDQPKAHWVIDSRIGSESQPFAIKTPLGWVLLGPMEYQTERMVNHLELKGETVEENLEELTTRLYNAEFEDLCSGGRGMSRDEATALEMVATKTIRTNGRYEVPLPWKTYPPNLIDNREYAHRRLNGLKRRFAADPRLLNRYHQIIQDHLGKGYVARVEQEPRGREEVWYIPHHPVTNPKKPEKLRIVFDCAARYRGTSINDCLHSGPDTTANLVAVLIRFRQSPVAIVGDIEEMFLQVALPKGDQDWMRFLWWDEANVEQEPTTYKMLVHPFGATSSPFCANYALKSAITDDDGNLSDCSKKIARHCIYVDDCIASVRDIETAKRVIRELGEAAQKGGFKLKKWLSNQREALVDLPPKDLAKDVKMFSAIELPTERTLGVEWSAEHDELRFRIGDLNKANTRRGVLSTIASIFDPLGLISPIILSAKILLQDLCREKMEWDQALEGIQLNRWVNWKEEMNSFKLVRIPRCMIAQGDINSLSQLHIFADASETGYGAVAYIRTTDGDGVSNCRLLMAKARVAPLKAVTIPRLELNAAVLAVRMGRFICNEWDEEFKKIQYWADSVIVLRYLHNTTSRFATFVSNRVQEILESSQVSQWRHIPSQLNPADHVSRGLPVKEESIRAWIEGPEFLRLSESDWPQGPTLAAGEDELELKRGAILHIAQGSQAGADRLLSHYSNWFKVKKAVAWFRRFVNYLRIMKGRQVSIKVGRLCIEEIEQAEKSILRYVQKCKYPREFMEVVEGRRNGCKVEWRLSELRKLCPRERDGLLVVDSRLKLANVPDSFKFPIILPKEHPITNVIVMYYHQREGHSGTSHILSKVRERFWIIHGAATVKRNLRKCLRCRILNATSTKQKMAPLPVQRVEDGWYPFQHTGVDYFGPFQVKRGRLLEKRYGCLFTCLQCRAVHLEVAHSLSTDSFVLAFTRFMNRRGVPKEIKSDNGTNFVGAEKELREWITCLDQNKIVDCLTERSIKWVFNPPSASHRGGIWERMIRTTRKILNSVAWRQSLDEELLWTYLTEAERIINDRPLTMILEGTGENKPLRPSDLLQPRSGECIVINIPNNQLIEKRWRIMNNLVAEFWRRWRTEYLAALQERHKWTSQQKELIKGDLVITEVESTPRTYWPLGIVEGTTMDGDNMVRTVNIRTAGGMIKRDIRKVYRLEGES